MSWHGRQVIAHLDERELYGERAYWRRHHHSLTTAEKRRIKAENYNSFRRPVRPGFGEGDWLEVTKKVHIQIADVQPFKGKYRIRIAGVRDFRGPGGTPIKTWGEDAASMSYTLSISGDRTPNPPEPQGVGQAWLRRFADEARVKRVDHIREAIEG